ncbi:hypothetical protein MMC24_007790 [Lignoscripta atroalba]|nr:hypothetical protein [Lignoscripta atroalba]
MAAQKEEDFVKGDGGYISDESSFYGDDELRSELEHRSATFSPSTYWSTHKSNLTTLALANIASATTTPSSTAPLKLYNPYEGSLSARQLSESIPSFLSRLPPSTTSSLTTGPWISIANPYTTHRLTSSDWASFITLGERILSSFTAQKSALESSMKGRPKGAITRKLTPLRKTVEEQLLAAAKETRCTSGKWMLFPMPEEVDRTWEAVAQGTARGELGIAAKVATDEGGGDRVPRLVCVYTADFADKKDVRRVLEGLVEMGLVKKRGVMGEERGVFYKCDAYTHLGINSGNEWGLKASLYASKDVLAQSDY